MSKPFILLLAVTIFLIPVQVSGYEFEGIPLLPKVFDPPYDRELYNHWIDDDGDREDTRQEVLIEESLIPATVRTKPNGKRKVIDGLWLGVYTGFITTDPKDLQIDHMIPLKEVHISGGHAWDAQKKQDFANDLDHSQALIAVKGGVIGVTALVPAIEGSAVVGVELGLLCKPLG